MPETAPDLRKQDFRRSGDSVQGRSRPFSAVERTALLPVCSPRCSPASGSSCSTGGCLGQRSGGVVGSVSATILAQSARDGAAGHDNGSGAPWCRDQPQVTDRPRGTFRCLFMVTCSFSRCGTWRSSDGATMCTLMPFDLHKGPHANLDPLISLSYWMAVPLSRSASVRTRSLYRTSAPMTTA